MKRTLFILSLTLTWLFSQSQMEVVKQDTWKIKWNKKVLVEANAENETKNTKKLKKTELSKKYSLEISYKESDPAKIKTLKRSFMFFGDSDNELLSKEDTRSLTLTAAKLKALFGNQKQIKIYTIAIPTDPDLAARVRVRRVHLCTLELQ